MANKYKGETIVDCDGVKYLFVINFGVISEIEESTDRTLLSIFINLLRTGDISVTDILSILSHCLIKVSGKEPLDKEGVIKDLISSYGLSECGALVGILLGYGAIGDEKKQRAQRVEAMQTTLGEMINSPLESLKKLPLLWALTLASFGISLCLAISLYVLHGV